MIYIGFSTKTNKLYARIFCRHFRHVAPILITNNKCIMYQFISHKKIALITLQPRDLKILELYGWKFIEYRGKIDLQHALKTKSVNCVQFTKHTCKIKNIMIQTPDTLFRYLCNK